MARKGHRKSRAGCIECKRRRIKCDELRPICRRCTIAERHCVYEATDRSSAPTSLTQNHIDHDGPISGLSQPTAASPLQRELGYLSQSPADQSGPTLDSTYAHIELFYNFEHSTCKTIGRTENDIEQYRKAIIGRAFLRPFLMHAMLALSALQMALEKPSQAASYRHTAAVLQAKALEDFDSNCLQNVNKSNVLDVLLFQHLTALHVICDLFNNFEDDFNEFIEQVVGCTRLLRGMNSVIQTWWDFLSQTELGVLMRTSNEHQEQPHHTLGECDRLRDTMREADLSERSIEVCQTSIRKLQTYFDAENHLGDGPIESTNMLFSWLITASPEYTELLGQRKPEALLILAHYAVLLHRRRTSWAVNDAGQKLLKQIKKYLGKRWEEHLAWPVLSVFPQEQSYGACST